VCWAEVTAATLKSAEEQLKAPRFRGALPVARSIFIPSVSHERVVWMPGTVFRNLWISSKFNALANTCFDSNTYGQRISTDLK